MKTYLVADFYLKKDLNTYLDNIVICHLYSIKL